MRSHRLPNLVSDAAERRASALQRLDGDVADLLVIGGGIVGSRVAYEGAGVRPQGCIDRPGRFRRRDIGRVFEAHPRRPSLPRNRRHETGARAPTRAGCAQVAGRPSPGSAAQLRVCSRALAYEVQRSSSRPLPSTRLPPASADRGPGCSPVRKRWSHSARPGCNLCVRAGRGGFDPRCQAGTLMAGGARRSVRRH